jgi:hypothetical protein
MVPPTERFNWRWIEARSMAVIEQVEAATGADPGRRADSPAFGRLQSNVIESMIASRSNL